MGCPAGAAEGRCRGQRGVRQGQGWSPRPGCRQRRTPLSGRTPESLGEDSLLSGSLAAAIVNGLQDGSDGKLVSADLKHFVANEQELDRQTSSSNLDERTLREVYGLPYEILLGKRHPASVMCSYNQIDGAYACENSLVTSLLKNDYGFDGYVVSDFGAVHSTAASLVNGMDQELNQPRYFTPANLDAALVAGLIDQSQIDAAAFRVVKAYIAAGLFDHSVPTAAVENASTAANKATALKIAQKGSVLLKNDRVLPLSRIAGKRIALIGPTVSATPTGGISASSVCSMAWRFNNAGTLNCEGLVTPETAITARAAQAGATVVVNNGADLASATAAAADVAVAFGYQRMGESSDLTDLHLQGGGDALVSAVAAANPQTVVVLQTGSAVEMPWLGSVKGVLETWYAGEQMGPALASLLFGDVTPSGKLPMTFPASLTDTPTATSTAQYPGTFADGSTTRPAGSTEIRQVAYSEGLAVGYRWYESQGIAPLFPFGFGLSDTSFSYDKVMVTPQSTDGSGALKVRFRLTNTGDRTGSVTAQVYVTLPSSAGEPGRRPVAWKAVELRPGEKKNVEITISAADLASQHLLRYWDATSASWTTASGRYAVTVGGSSEATLASSFTVRAHQGHGRGLIAGLA